MYIFLSHNYLDKDVVEPVALKLREKYGQNNIFYDSWSIQPGDGIIDKMNEGLENMDFFFFFISRNSLNSKMVELEWQNAIYKKAKGKCRFIPIKIDDCNMPLIMLQNLYIDFYNNGFDVGLSQLIDVLDGNNTYSQNNIIFNNVVCNVKQISVCEYELEYVATKFNEPVSRYCVLFHENPEDIEFELLTDSIYSGGKIENWELRDKSKWNGYAFSLMRSTTPNFPIRIKIKNKNGFALGRILAMQCKTEGKYSGLNMIAIK